MTKWFVISILTAEGGPKQHLSKTTHLQLILLFINSSDQKAAFLLKDKPCYFTWWFSGILFNVEYHNIYSIKDEMS